jgi:hypothetical protein
MAEDFAVSYSVPELQTHYGPGIPSDVEQDAREALAPLVTDPSQLTITTGDAGYNASAVTLVLILVGIFLAGKRIDDSIAAWASIADRFRAVIDGLRKRRGEVRVSEPAAIVLALDALEVQGVPLDGIHLLAAHTLPVAKGVVPPEFVADFAHQPDRFYILIFRTAEDVTYVVRLRSNCEFEEILRLPTGDWADYYGIGKRQ